MKCYVRMYFDPTMRVFPIQIERDSSVLFLPLSANSSVIVTHLPDSLFMANRTRCATCSTAYIFVSPRIFFFTFTSFSLGLLQAAICITTNSTYRIRVFIHIGDERMFSDMFNTQIKYWVDQHYGQGTTLIRVINHLTIARMRVYVCSPVFDIGVSNCQLPRNQRRIHITKVVV